MRRLGNVSVATESAQVILVSLLELAILVSIAMVTVSSSRTPWAGSRLPASGSKLTAGARRVRRDGSDHQATNV